MERIVLDVTRMFGKIPQWELKMEEIEALIPVIQVYHAMLMKGEGDIADNGIVMTGWLDLPYKIGEEHLAGLHELARELAMAVDAFVSVGIGGSYLGIEATIRALVPYYYNQMSREERKGYPEIYFLGNNMDPDYITDTLALLKGKRVGINVISKSGTTLETAIAFRILRSFLREGRDKERPELIIASTDKERGALLSIAKGLGLRTLEIPKDIGGRFSVLTDPLLFSIAMAGINLVEFWQGFLEMAEITSTDDFWKNPSLVHSLMRYLAWQKGKRIEVVATNSNYLYPVARWMEQLFPESEGHYGKGLWVSPSLYTEKLHANGQMVQDGPRDLLETFLILREHRGEVEIPLDQEDLDGLNFLIKNGFGKVGLVNKAAMEGTAIAHYNSGVPNMTIEVPKREPRFLGQLYFMLEKSVALSGYLLGHNPFIQPGVEAYKKSMYALLGKPGTEKYARELLKERSKLEIRRV